MKLKEKLAREQVKTFVPTITPTDSSYNHEAKICEWVFEDLYSKIYLAGFEKAKQMAASKFNNEPDAEWEGEFIAFAIEELGEAEVND